MKCSGVLSIVDRCLYILEFLQDVQIDRYVPGGPEADCRAVYTGRMLTPREMRLWNSAISVCDSVLSSIVPSGSEAGAVVDGK